MPCPTGGAAVKEHVQPVRPYRRLTEEKTIVGNEAILKEVDVLNGVGTNLQGLADEHVAISNELLRAAESVRNVATLLAVLVATTTG